MQLIQGVLPFKLDVVDQAVRVTAHGGLPLVVEALRALVPRDMWVELRDALGYRSVGPVRRHVESLVLLTAAGGECIDDIEALRADAGLVALLGGEPSSPAALKEFLYRFHQDVEGRELTAQQDGELSKRGHAQIRAEGPGLVALAAVVAQVVDAVQRQAVKQRATLDIDATIVEAHKRQALYAYEGTRGYQPQMAWWAEQAMFVCDEFRDGNVPAEFEAMAFLKKTLARLPASVTQLRMRADSALYNERALTWADAADIEFAVSADMSEELRKHVERIDEAQWQPYRTLTETERTTVNEERQWAEVTTFVPEWGRNRKRDGRPFRYVAIRVRDCQRELFEPQAAPWRHYAVVTNMDWAGESLLRWHREKQGTIEHAHRVMKDELAGGVLPCGRFGANAAWWRLNVLTANLMQALRVIALPARMARMRPKALRLHLFGIAGQVVDHARQFVLRISSVLPAAKDYALARVRLLAVMQQRLAAAT